MRNDSALEVRLRRKDSTRLSISQSGEHLGIADVVTRLDHCDRNSEGSTPGGERLATGDGADRETMPEENGVRELNDVASQIDLRARIELAGGDADVIVRNRESGDGGKEKRG